MIFDRIASNKRIVSLLLLIGLGGMTVLWLGFAPEGLQGKLQAIGYGVCHQIASHSYTINGMVLPLCSRCSGLFLGAAATIAVLSSQARRGGFPKANLRLVLILFAAFYVLDGVNSTLTLFNGWRGVYPPSNLLRLTSGAGMGVTLGAMLMSIWNQVLWADAEEVPLVNSYRLLGLCVVVAALAAVLVVIHVRLLYYPLAILSAGSVILLLAMVYTLIWALALKKDYSLRRWQDSVWLFLLGGLSASIQLAAMDALRFALTGTWQGFVL